MYFLIKPVYYNLIGPVLLLKTKYNYQVKELDVADVNNINNILQGMDTTMKIKGPNIYINGTNLNFLTNTYPNSSMEYRDNLKWSLSICIQGYKTSQCNRSSPIIKIIKAIQD